MGIARTRRARAQRRRQRRMKRVEHDLTDAQWAALTDAWGGCAYCGKTDPALQRDCVLALSRGGRYTLGNVVPACRSCNASKWNEEVTRWLRRKRLDEQRFLLRHTAILRDLRELHAQSVDPESVGASLVKTTAEEHPNEVHAAGVLGHRANERPGRSRLR